MNKVAIMQPYFLPYIGYWQLINAVDSFVVYDNIEYTKKGWFNRNRLLQGDHDRLFTIPIKKASDYLPVNQRFLSEDSDNLNAKTLRLIETTYKKAPEFNRVFPAVKDCFEGSEKNLFGFIYGSIQIICKLLKLKTRIIVSSSVSIDHSLRAEQKILAICQQLNAATYINAIGGLELYDKNKFKSKGIELKFLEPTDVTYPQFNNKFVPWLSIIDVLMFNNQAEITKLLSKFELL